MIHWKRLFYYLSINIFVSACTILSILFLWDRYHSPPSAELAASLLQEVRQTSVAVAATEEPVTLPSPTPQPTRALGVYQVAAGDTLGHIALKYEISVQELMAINGMTDPDALGSGQVIFVPAPSPTPALQETPSVASPQAQPDQNDINIANVFGAGDLPTERVRLEKKGQSELSLAGWKLVGESEEAFVFPNLALFQDSSIDVYSRSGANSAFALYWGRETPSWQTGETLRLLDQNGAVRSTYRVP